jgi:multidrug efflux pump subunit AcrB
MTLDQLIPVLQMAIGPTILISGVGMLLLVMTNRLGRTIDRARHVVAVLRQGNETELKRNQAQLDILWKRARTLRIAIALAAASALLAALLVIAIFFSVLMNWQLIWLITALFVGCLAAVCLSLVYFLRDINMTLSALELEIGE